MVNNIKALKSGVWYTASNLLVKSIGFITTPFFTRILTHAEYGVFSNFTSWLSIMTIFVTLNLESTLISARFDYEDDFDGYILSMLSLSFISTLLWLLIMNLGSNFFSSFMNLDIKYINAMLVYLLFLPAVSMFQTRERYYFDYKKTVLTSIILAVGTAMLSVVLVVYLTDSLLGRIIGSIVPTILMGLYFYYFFIREGKNINIDHWMYAIPICLPYIPHLLSMTLLNSTDKVMITKICGAEETALYSLAYTCGIIITLLITSLNGAFAPWLGERINNDEYESVKSFSYIYVLAFLFMAIGIMLISPEVLFILGGDSYMEAIYVLAPVSMGCICQFLYTMFVNVEQFKKKTSGMAIGSAMAAIVNFGLNMIFIPKIGYLAAAYTTLISYILLLLIHMYLVRRLGFQELYDYKFIGGVVITGIVIMTIIIFLYSHTLLRYMLIVVYSFIAAYTLLKNKYKILDLYRNRS